MLRSLRLSLIAASLLSLGAWAADFPSPREQDYIIPDFHFVSGETLALRLHYRTLGRPVRDAKGVVRNAVLILHGTTGSGANFIQDIFAGELFGAGQPLDAARYFIIIPDAIGHGLSSRPSDGLHARFPRYTYEDMVRAQYRLLTEGLGVDHLRLVMGTSMGGMHTWVWGGLYPDFMDALMPLACLPVEIAGRNRMWRKMAIDAIVSDPVWDAGEYKVQPPGLSVAIRLLLLMSSNPVLRQKELPTQKAADDYLATETGRRMASADANDFLYALRASEGYDPSRALDRITAPLVAVNFADDLINPPELGVLESLIRKVRLGEAVLIPMGEKSRGHGSHTVAALWKDHLLRLLQRAPLRP
jgi:homoserine O-acetyltransferase